MKALRLSSLNGPSSLELTDLPAEPELDPLFAGHDPVVIEVHAAGVAFPELLQTYGKYQHAAALPFVPGGEVSGVVISAPAGGSVQPGQRVVGFTQSGGFAQTAVAPAMLTFPMHPAFDFAQGAGYLMNYHTAYFSLVTRGGLQPGEWVAVHGAAGGVGTATIQVAKGLGARVIAVVSDSAKGAVAREMGADVVVRSDGPWKDEIIEASSGGVDMTIDPVGGDRALDIMRSLREGGRWVVVGFAGGGIPEIKVNRLLLRNLSAIGAGWGAFAFTRPALSAQIDAALQPLIDSGHVAPYVTARFALADGPAALVHLEERKALGKIVIEVRPPIA